jgi:hypothetical protein
MRLLIQLFVILLSSLIFAQENKDSNAIDFTLFRGNVIPHSPDLYHLITGHPEGVMLSFSKKTYGHEEWHSIYNYPDYGVYFLYQDFKNELLGKSYATGAFYNFYFLKRNLNLKVATGLATTTNPYDKQTNSKNKAFGSKVMANIDFALNYKKENIIDKLGIQGGLLFTHFSNGRFKSPNSGINTYCLNLGINYNFDEGQNQPRDSIFSKMKYVEPVKYNTVLRTGFNESPVVGSGQKPFYHIGFYIDKRVNRKSALQAGTELFLTTSFKEFIKYRSIAYPENHVDYNTDYKRVGVFLGHELFINRISIETQLGYYVYQPFKYDSSFYDRVGMKYYVSPKIFSGISLVTHGFLAEALEFIVGVRL